MNEILKQSRLKRVGPPDKDRDELPKIIRLLLHPGLKSGIWFGRAPEDKPSDFGKIGKYPQNEIVLLLPGVIVWRGEYYSRKELVPCLYHDKIIVLYSSEIADL